MNYKSWNIKISDFRKTKSNIERLKVVVNFGILAPSGHNTQPWKVSISEKSIGIFIENERRLLVGDPTDRLLHISIGCFIENILISLDYFGYKYNLKLVNSKNNKIANIEIKSHKLNKHSKEHLLNFIPHRVTNRNKYSMTEDYKRVIRNIKKLKFYNLHFDYLESSSNTKSLCEDVIDANIETFENSDFRKELSRHIRTNITKKGTGMPAFGMGMPTLVSFIVPFLIKKINVNKLSKRDDLKLLIDHTPIYCLISSKGNSHKDWINIGRFYERIALIATSVGMSTHPMAGPIILVKYKKKIKKHFNTLYEPQMFFRLGKPLGKTRHSPRLAISDIIRI